MVSYFRRRTAGWSQRFQSLKPWKWWITRERREKRLRNTKYKLKSGDFLVIWFQIYYIFYWAMIFSLFNIAWLSGFVIRQFRIFCGNWLWLFQLHCFGNNPLPCTILLFELLCGKLDIPSIHMIQIACCWWQRLGVGWSMTGAGFRVVCDGLTQCTLPCS